MVHSPITTILKTKFIHLSFADNVLILISPVQAVREFEHLSGLSISRAAFFLFSVLIWGWDWPNLLLNGVISWYVTRFLLWCFCLHQEAYNNKLWASSSACQDQNKLLVSQDIYLRFSKKKIHWEKYIHVFFFFFYGKKHLMERTMQE